jgi:hypothetical protein
MIEVGIPGCTWAQLHWQPHKRVTNITAQNAIQQGHHARLLQASAVSYGHSRLSPLSSSVTSVLTLAGLSSALDGQMITGMIS